MSGGRLTASVEATGLVRQAEAEGGFAAILHKGDAERGALLIVVRSRGTFISCLERTLGLDGRYGWATAGPQGSEDEAGLSEFLGSRLKFDPDLWLIELDVAQPERFIAETTSAA